MCWCEWASECIVISLCLLLYSTLLIQNDFGLRMFTMKWSQCTRDCIHEWVDKFNCMYRKSFGGRTTIILFHFPLFLPVYFLFDNISKAWTLTKHSRNTQIFPLRSSSIGECEMPDWSEGVLNMYGLSAFLWNEWSTVVVIHDIEGFFPNWLMNRNKVAETQKKTIL